MTRFARAGKRKFLEASTWGDLSGKQANINPASQRDEAPLPTRKEKIFSRGKRDITHQKSEKTAIDPKRQKQIEARRLRRKKRKCCFVCRQYGHQAVECPNKNDMKIGNCFKCGASEHTTKSCKANIDEKSSGPFPFAKCFICQEMGHLARSCPENPRGLYPQGGGCKMCGSVEHLRRDCPQLLKKKNKDHTAETISLEVAENTSHKSADAEDVGDISQQKKKHGKRKEKTVTF